MVKYKGIANRMALFLAGSVDHWIDAITSIQMVENQVTVDNIIDPNGPLICELGSCMWQKQYVPEGNNDIGALGVIVDSITETNTPFKIHGVAGRGCSISPVPDRSCLVMGSGEQIPNIQHSLLQSINQHVQKSGENLNDIGNIMRTRLKEILKNCGASSFEKLGISPVFAVSLLNKGAFRMNGEEIEGEFYSSTDQPSRHFHYSFTQENGQPLLRDHISNSDIHVKDINDFRPLHTNRIFDPEGLTTGFDPTVISPTNGLFYIINQWVTNDSIIRSVYKASYFTFRGKTLCNPDWRPIASDMLEHVPIAELTKYTNPGYYVLEISPADSVAFESLVHQHMFNHQLLGRFIMNYGGLYHV